MENSPNLFRFVTHYEGTVGEQVDVSGSLFQKESQTV